MSDAITKTVSMTGTCRNPACGASLSASEIVTFPAGYSGTTSDFASCTCGTTSPVSGSFS